MISAVQVADTLALLVPGFVALKIFYWFGQRTKRADWEWALWSILIAAPIGYFANLIAEALGSRGAPISETAADCALTSAAGKTGADFTSAVSACVDGAIGSHNADVRLFIAILIAVAFGLVGAWAWVVLTDRVPSLRNRATLDAWDAVMRTGPWVQVKVGDLIYRGKVRYAADSTETDKVDLYLQRPALVHGGTLTELDQTEGVLIARDQITWIQVLKPAPKPAVR